MPEWLWGAFRNFDSFRRDRWNKVSLLEHKSAGVKVDLPTLPKASLKPFQRYAVYFSARFTFQSTQPNNDCSCCKQGCLT
jgi:hypothetical protein